MFFSPAPVEVPWAVTHRLKVTQTVTVEFCNTQKSKFHSIEFVLKTPTMSFFFYCYQSTFAQPFTVLELFSNRCMHFTICLSKTTVRIFCTVSPQLPVFSEFPVFNHCSIYVLMVQDVVDLVSFHNVVLSFSAAELHDLLVPDLQRVFWFDHHGSVLPAPSPCSIHSLSSRREWRV